MGRAAQGRAVSSACVSIRLPLPAAFPPSNEGQILSIAPALKSLLPIMVRNSPGLGASYLWRPVRKEEWKEECSELPDLPSPAARPPQLLS